MRLVSCSLSLLLVGILAGFAAVSAVSETWWTAPDAKWWAVAKDYNWKRRRTGVEKEWTVHFGHWMHYKTNIVRRRRSLVLTPKPWTEGSMCKFLRRCKSANNFELLSVFTESAKGNFSKLWIKERVDRDDDVPLWQNGYVFSKTPYRITNLPSVLPEALLQAGASASRATIVYPDGCTVSGPRWLPTSKEAADLKEWTDEEGKPAFRFQFFELWLAEGTAESDKVGAFAVYDGITGELIDLICMKEVGLPSSLRHNPKKAVALKALKSSIEGKDRLTRTEMLDPALRKALRKGKSLKEIFSGRRFDAFRGRAVKYASPGGPEEEYVVQEKGEMAFSEESSPHGSSGHVDIRFDDGRYLCIPKSMDGFSDSDTICLEMGCLRLDGGFHRVRIMGSRNTHFDHCVYERWN